MRKRRKARLSIFLILAALLMLTVIFAQKLCPYDPNAQDISQSLLSPGASHLAGTDRFGRDLFSRILAGLQTSVLSALALVAIITVVGTDVYKRQEYVRAL